MIDPDGGISQLLRLTEQIISRLIGVVGRPANFITTELLRGGHTDLAELLERQIHPGRLCKAGTIDKQSHPGLLGGGEQASLD